MASGDWIVIPNWSRFQHYRDRDPAWIKNHRSLLADPDYLGLSLRLRAILHGLWLLYAASDGRVSGSSVARLGRELGDDSVRRRDIESLRDAGFVELSASRPLALRYQVARPEVEEEKNPLTPTSGGRRSNGTNPRALAAQLAAGKRDALLDAGIVAARSWQRATTDQLHDDLDRLEREHGATFTDQERTKLIDEALARWSR